MEVLHLGSAETVLRQKHLEEFRAVLVLLLEVILLLLVLSRKSDQAEYPVLDQALEVAQDSEEALLEVLQDLEGPVSHLLAQDSEE